MSTGLKSWIENIIDIIFMSFILGGVALGMQFNNLYYGISAVAIILLITRFTIKKRKRIEGEKEIIAKQWGKEHREERDCSSIRSMFDFFNRENSQFFIDDITWNDLNMDNTFNKVDHTKSLPGMQYLYNILRNPLFDKNLLHRRNSIVSSIEENKGICLINIERQFLGYMNY